jgi:hypothetical protein
MEGYSIADIIKVVDIVATAWVNIGLHLIATMVVVEGPAMHTTPHAANQQYQECGA